MNNNVFFVVAYNLNHFQRWCRQHDIRPQGGNVRYLLDWEQVRGVLDYNVILVEDWYDRDNRRLNEILDEVVIPRAASVYHVPPTKPVVNEQGHIIAMDAARKAVEALRAQAQPPQQLDATILLSCPFCGGKAVTQEHGDNSPAWMVYCDKCECVMDINYRTQAEAIEAWNRRAQPPQQAMDAPDGPGWWAFEGRWIMSLSGYTFQHPVEVSLGKNNKLYVTVSGRIGSPDELVGKWYRLTMPWDAQPPAPQPVPDAVRQDIGDLLLLVKDAKFKDYLPDANWSIIARVESWLAQQPDANDLGSHSTQRRAE